MNVYISKSKVISKLWSDLSPVLTPDVIRTVVDMIQSLDPADVKEAKRAKWVKYPCVWECSECRHWEDRRYNDNPPQFCSRCGAEMG